MEWGTIIIRIVIVVIVVINSDCFSFWLGSSFCFFFGWGSFAFHIGNVLFHDLKALHYSAHHGEHGLALCQCHWSSKVLKALRPLFFLHPLGAF